MKKILTHPFVVYIVSFLVISVYVLLDRGCFYQEWLWGVAVFAVPVMFPVAFIMEFLSVFVDEAS